MATFPCILMIIKGVCLLEFYSAELEMCLLIIKIVSIFQQDLKKNPSGHLLPWLPNRSGDTDSAVGEVK